MSSTTVFLPQVQVGTFVALEGRKGRWEIIKRHNGTHNAVTAKNKRGYEISFCLTHVTKVF